MIPSLILGAVWNYILGILAAFWPWLLGGASAVLAFLFSPTIRKYTMAALAIGLVLIITFVGGYNSNHTVQKQLPTCTDFKKYATISDKTLASFQRHGLCE